MYNIKLTLWNACYNINVMPGNVCYILREYWGMNVIINLVAVWSELFFFISVTLSCSFFSLTLPCLSSAWLCTSFLQRDSALPFFRVTLHCLSSAWLCSAFLQRGSALPFFSVTLPCLSSGWLCIAFLQRDSALPFFSVTPFCCISTSAQPLYNQVNEC